jgi:hypothetical protein
LIVCHDEGPSMLGEQASADILAACPARARQQNQKQKAWAACKYPRSVNLELQFAAANLAEASTRRLAE